MKLQKGILQKMMMVCIKNNILLYMGMLNTILYLHVSNSYYDIVTTLEISF